MLRREMLSENRDRYNRRNDDPAVRARNHRLIELGGLIVKSGLHVMLSDNRNAIYGALIELVEMSEGQRGSYARARWLDRGTRLQDADRRAKAERAELSNNEGQCYD